MRLRQQKQVLFAYRFPAVHRKAKKINQFEKSQERIHQQDQNKKIKQDQSPISIRRKPNIIERRSLRKNAILLMNFIELSNQKFNINQIYGQSGKYRQFLEKCIKEREKKNRKKNNQQGKQIQRQKQEEENKLKKYKQEKKKKSLKKGKDRERSKTNQKKIKRKLKSRSKKSTKSRSYTNTKQKSQKMNHKQEKTSKSKDKKKNKQQGLQFQPNFKSKIDMPWLQKAKQVLLQKNKHQCNKKTKKKHSDKVKNNKTEKKDERINIKIKLNNNNKNKKTDQDYEQQRQSSIQSKQTSSWNIHVLPPIQTKKRNPNNLIIDYSLLEQQNGHKKQSNVKKRKIIKKNRKTNKVIIEKDQHSLLIEYDQLLKESKYLIQADQLIIEEESCT